MRGRPQHGAWFCDNCLANEGASGGGGESRRRLAAATERLSELGFGDFDADGCD